MHTPEHCCIPAQPSSNVDPFMADAPVAGGTWQLPQAPVNPPLLSLEDIRAQANFHAQNLHGPGLGRGCRRERGIANSNSPRILSLEEVHSIHNQLSTPPPSANISANNQFSGYSAAQLRIAAEMIPASAPPLPPPPAPPPTPQP